MLKYSFNQGSPTDEVQDEIHIQVWLTGSEHDVTSEQLGCFFGSAL